MAARGTSASLTEEELEALRAAVADGRRPTVYLREPIPSLDVPAGASAKVLAIAGRTLTVKPRRIHDELPYEAEELRMTRTAPEPKPRPRRTSAGKTGTAATAAAGRSAAATAPAPAVRAAQRTAPQGAPAAREARAAKAAAPSRSRRGPAAVTVTIEGSAAAAPHEWTATVTGGGSRSARPTPVTAEAVVRAVEALGVPAADKAVAAVLATARAEAERRVQDLARELEEAKKALRSLGD